MAKRRVLFPGITHVVAEDMERWLEAMALQGWYPEAIGDSSGLMMTFIKGEPGQVRYVFDSPDMIGPDYERHYEGYGWELVGKMGDVMLWRAPYSGSLRPETFADPQDIGRHNRRIYSYLSAGFMLCTFLMAMLTMVIWRSSGTVPLGNTLAVLASDIGVFVLLGALRYIQKKMEMGDRLRIKPPEPGGTNRLV